jgi:hypothetical protein
LQSELADVHRIEKPSPPRVGQPKPDLAANFRLVKSNQLGGGLLIAGAYPLDKKSK